MKPRARLSLAVPLILAVAGCSSPAPQGATSSVPPLAATDGQPTPGQPAPQAAQGQGTDYAELPFAIEPTQGHRHDLLCIRLDRHCSGPTNQGTRILDSPLVGNDDLGTPLMCGSMWSPPGDAKPGSDATIDDRVANHVAAGMDHVVVTYAEGDDIRVDDCGPLTPEPRQVPTNPNWVYATELDNLAGNEPEAAQLLMDGVAQGLAFGTTFSDDGPPRLQRFPEGWDWTRTLVKDGQQYVVDDRPLWDYIRSDATNIPASCANDSFDASDPGDPQNSGPTIGHLVNCLSDWRPTHAPLFDADSDGDGTYDILVSPRVALVPVVGRPGGTNYPPSPVLYFELAFIQTLYMSSAADCPCVAYDPGDTSLADPLDLTGMQAVGMALFRIQEAMLPASARPNP